MLRERQEMTTIVCASCPQCGKVEQDSCEFCYFSNDYNEGCFLSFPCPKCGERITKNASYEAIQLLFPTDAKQIKVPKEMRERHIGTQITHDDLLRFHNLLYNSNALRLSLEQYIPQLRI